MIRERDGIHFELDRHVVADATSAAGDVNVVSHAHSDHAPGRRAGAAAETVVCSPLTAALVEARSGVSLDFAESAPGVELLPSGHVAGSRAALIGDGDGTRYLYTGDVSTRNRAYLSGFEPVDADVLVVEATYGRPDYRFPPQDELDAQVRDWLADTDRPAVLFGYSLGRAQKLQRLAARATNRRVVVHDAVHEVNETIEAYTDVTFDVVPYADAGSVRADDVVVAPLGARKSGWVADAIDRFDAVTAGFSGWAVKESYRYRVGVDRAFPLTDHCDFDELVALVEAVDPDRVYTHHGFAAAFAGHLSSRCGYDAVALVRGQSRLDEF